jgi:hypothetical protein
MRRTIRFVRVVIAICALVGCAEKTEPAISEKPMTAPSPLAVATILLPEGHRVDFFAPPDGPVAIAEIGPKGAARVVNDTLARKKPSEIYAMLKGPGAVPPPALVEAERRMSAVAPTVAPRPAPIQGRAGSGPDDTGDQQWFKATFCVEGWECIQGWSWANGSGGHHVGRGYAADAMNGSEARAARTLETDWWNGSSWATLITESMPAGWSASTWGGNTGALSCNNPTWYFKSEIPDNGTGDFATVSLADHMYSPGGGGNISCSGRCTCPCGCTGCRRGGKGPGGRRPPYVTCARITLCSDDSCVNPP